MKKTCNVCNKEFEAKSVYDGLIYGIRVCSNECKEKATVITKTDVSWSRKTDQERKVYAKDLIQPFSNGKINEDFVSVHGTQAYERNHGISQEDVRKQL